MLLIVKKNNSRHLKLRTKQNEVIIEQKRKMELEAKRKIKERVVQSQAIAQERIHIYHLVRYRLEDAGRKV